jgi:hypothetical protein
MSQPAGPPQRRHRRTVVSGRVALAALAVAVVAAGVLAWLAARPSGSGRPVAAAPPRPAPSTTSVPAAPSPTRTLPPPVPHEAVAPSRPTSMVLTGKRFTIRAHVCAMANIRPYDPPGEQHHTVCWVREGFGVAPSSRAATSYLFGHSWAEDGQEVLNRASAPATREILRVKPQKLDGVTVYPVHALDGYRLLLRTRTGVLTYAVRRVYGVRKLDLGGISSWMDETVRNRVLLTTCAEWKGRDYDYNVVIEAYLTSSEAVAPRRGA